MLQQPGEYFADTANLREHLQHRTADDLRAELDHIFAEEANSGIKIQQEVVDEYLKAIARGEAKGSIDGDFQTSWETFAQNHPALFEKTQPKKRRRIPARYLIEAAAVICVLLVSSAAAFPAQWNAVVSWGKDILNIAPPPSGAMENTELAEFPSLASAVESLGIDTNTLPTWIPQQFSIEKVAVQETVSYDRAAALYSGGNKSTVTIRVTHYYDAAKMPDFSLEIDDNGENTYIKDGTTYYLSENLGVLQTKWVQGDCAYSIVGNLSYDELQKIIDSIPEADHT